MKFLTQLLIAFSLLLAIAVNLSISATISEKVCRTDVCGGFAGFRCCEGYFCQLPDKCCDFLGKCIPQM
ncbi:hypothetical protein BLOT_014230 [Blomia tropicalis]|nr:hypothetical protein BLOT_014230 [Blomia tropicalis]